MFAPTTLDFRQLFRDPDMFDSRDSWRRAGFSVEGKGAESDVMVASHLSAEGYLFKKYNADISPKKQLKNFRCRIEGAEKLRDLITAQHLNRIVVPGKYLHKLPPEFRQEDESSYVLVVEKLNLLESSRSKQLYREIDAETLRQFCVVLREFRGLGSGTRNVPFTDQGQIAFVDTERWDHEKEEPLRHILPYLPDKRRTQAEKILRT